MTGANASSRVNLWRYALAPAMLFTSLGMPAMATAQDARLQNVFYDAGQVVQLRGRAKVQATIIFGDDERIENVAIGDSNAWQITPNKRANLLFVKPLEIRAATNMTVVTSKRTYLFDLVASPSHRPIYVLSFTYPEPPEEERAELAQREMAIEDELLAANDPYAVVDPAQLNFSWKAKGDRDLLPVQAYDDGTATFLAWPADRAMPAVLVTNEQEMEGPVNFTVRGDTLVIDGVPRQIILRSGKSRATLTNTGPVRPDIPQTGGVVPASAALARNTEAN